MDLHFDCAGGVAGDMLLGALCELHGSTELLTSVPAALNLNGVTVECSRTSRHHLAATRVVVKGEDSQPMRHLRDVLALLARSSLPEPVQATAGEVFLKLALAEAHVHGTTPDKVHFHEVGAADALVDIAGGCLLAHELSPGRITAGPLPLARGTVKAAHGELPLPAPATVELLKGWPVEWIEEQGERVTPTGAALIVTLATPARPAFGAIHRTGMGAGAADFKSRANVTRAFLLEPEEAPAHLQPVTELACVIDNSTGEDLAMALEILLGEGALDVYYQPALMKKGRPGWELGLICEPGSADRLAGSVLRVTGSSGVRRRDIVRYVLDRRVDTLSTRYGDIRVKSFELPDGSVRPAPEFEDCRRAALEHGVTAAVVRQAALQEWQSSEKVS